MVLFALYRRVVINPPRLTVNAEGNLILLLILGVVSTDLIYEAGKFNLIQIYGYDLHVLGHPFFGTEMDWAPFAALLAWATSGWGEGMMGI